MIYIYVNFIKILTKNQITYFIKWEIRRAKDISRLLYYQIWVFFSPLLEVSRAFIQLEINMLRKGWGQRQLVNEGNEDSTKKEHAERLFLYFLSWPPIMRVHAPLGSPQLSTIHGPFRMLSSSDSIIGPKNNFENIVCKEYSLIIFIYYLHTLLI